MLRQMTWELAGHPETSAQEEGMDGAVEVGQDNVGHEAADVKLDVARLDLVLNHLLR